MRFASAFLRGRAPACRAIESEMGDELDGLGAGAVSQRAIATVQPNLRFAFPTPAAGARDQTFRLMVQPDIWGRQTRVRLSNVFGTKPVTFDGVFAGLQLSGGAVVAGTNQRRALRAASRASPIPPGESVWSDPVALPFVKQSGAAGARRPQARGELSRRRRERPDDVARQGAHHVAISRRRAAARKARRRTKRHFPSPRPPGIFSTRST